MNEKQAREAANSGAIVIAEDMAVRVRGVVVEVDYELDGSVCVAVRGAVLAYTGFPVENPEDRGTCYYFAPEDVNLV